MNFVGDCAAMKNKSNIPLIEVMNGIGQMDSELCSINLILDITH
jgi:hypothetical protein